MLDQHKHASFYPQALGHLEGDQEALQAGTGFRNLRSLGLARSGRSHLERVDFVDGMTATSCNTAEVCRCWMIVLLTFFWEATETEGGQGGIVRRKGLIKFGGARRS